MRSFVLVSALLAAGSLAKPVLEKRDVLWETVYDISFETVYVDPSDDTTTSTLAAAPAPSAAPAQASVDSIVHNPIVHQKISTAAAVAAPVPTPAVTTTAEAVVATPAASTPSPSANVEASAAPASHAVPSDDTLQEAAVDGHNTVRALHQAGSLSWSDELAASAQALANTCEFGHNV